MTIPLFEQANALNVAGQFDEAEELYDMLLTQNHDNAGLLVTLGTMYLHNPKKVGLAMTLLHRGIERSGKQLPEAISNLGLAYKMSGQRDKAIHYMKKAVDIDPTPECLTNYAGLFVEGENQTEAIKMLNKAIEKDPSFALSHWNLSLMLLGEGQWEQGWKEYEWGQNPQGLRIDRNLGSLPKWDGTPGKTIAVYGEQGIGDEIMFASMIPDLLKTNDVILETQTRLQHLFEHSFGCRVYGTRGDEFVTWADDFDYQLSMASLGKYFRNKIEDFPGLPYLKADAVPKGDKFRIGISWTGGQKTGRVVKRSVPLSWWKEILDQDCEFVSLQYTDCAEEIAEVNKLGYDIKQFDEIKAEDYYETAKVVMSCDLVISVCTSVIHLAGALGVPCWVMVPVNPAWRYQNKGPMPWYKSVRLYRKNDSWLPIIQRIALDLSEHLKERKAA